MVESCEFPDCGVPAAALCVACRGAVCGAHGATLSREDGDWTWLCEDCAAEYRDLARARRPPRTFKIFATFTLIGLVMGAIALDTIPGAVMVGVIVGAITSALSWIAPYSERGEVDFGGPWYPPGNGGLGAGGLW
jgi:hypothetical protein